MFRRFAMRCFAPDGGTGGEGVPAAEPQGDGSQAQAPQGGGAAVPQFDYDKLASIIAGKQTIKIGRAHV